MNSNNIQQRTAIHTTAIHSLSMLELLNWQTGLDNRKSWLTTANTIQRHHSISNQAQHKQLTVTVNFLPQSHK